MMMIKTRLRPDLYEKIRADMKISQRGVQGEVAYLLERGLAAVEADAAILAGRTQLDASAFRGEVARP